MIFILDPKSAPPPTAAATAASTAPAAAAPPAAMEAAAATTDAAGYWWPVPAAVHLTRAAARATAHALPASVRIDFRRFAPVDVAESRRLRSTVHSRARFAFGATRRPLDIALARIRPFRVRAREVAFAGSGGQILAGARSAEILGPG